MAALDNMALSIVGGAEVDETPSFEGPEKVLEVWFVPPSEYEDDNCCDEDVVNHNTRHSLLAVPKETWVEMLDLVKCQILSEISNDKAVAYLLSESSMFVYDYQIVLKTCGTTTLLNCIPKLLEIAASVGLLKVDDIFYNRQNFFFPDRQLEPHFSFEAECKLLDGYFKNGGAYILGRINENHYNFYNAESRMNREDPYMQEKDSTLEILMTGLDPLRMAKFYHVEGRDCKDNKDIRDEIGISDFFPGALIDDFMFEPFGYSLNALMDDGYYTIHITPQPNCSFVSFETNVFMEDYTELINKVVQAFRPDRFILAHIANSHAAEHIPVTSPVATTAILSKGFDDAAIATKNGFRVIDDIFSHLEHYNIFFQQYQKVQGPMSPGADVHPISLRTRRRLDDCGTILKTPILKPRPYATSQFAINKIDDAFNGQVENKESVVEESTAQA